MLKPLTAFLDRNQGLKGLGKETSLIQNMMVPSLDNLSKAASLIDCNELTFAGRSLTKHGAESRPRNSLFPPARGNSRQISLQAQIIVDDILTIPKSNINYGYSGRFGKTIEVNSPDGRGIVYDVNGRFLFFKE